MKIFNVKVKDFLYVLSVIIFLIFTQIYGIYGAQKVDPRYIPVFFTDANIIFVLITLLFFLVSCDWLRKSNISIIISVTLALMLLCYIFLLYFFDGLAYYILKTETSGSSQKTIIESSLYIDNFFSLDLYTIIFVAFFSLSWIGRGIDFLPFKILSLTGLIGSGFVLFFLSVM